MSFEEQFPSLKGKRKNLGCAQGHLNCLGGEHRDYVIVPELRKYCLDKAKVKKAIESFNKEFQSASIRLKKELGLE